MKSGKKYKEEMRFYKKNLTEAEYQYLKKNTYKKKNQLFRLTFKKITLLTILYWKVK